LIRKGAFKKYDVTALYGGRSLIKAHFKRENWFNASAEREIYIIS
jgi:hypothetical protein